MTIDGSPRAGEGALSGEVNANVGGSGHARLPCDEAAPLEHLHHLVDARCGDKEVSLNVRLCGCSAKVMDVLGDEGKVFELTLGGTLWGVLCWRRGCTRYTREESI